MIKFVALALVVLVAAVLVVAATKPDTFQVQRTATIAAPPETIFPLINDLHSWGPWSPYEKKDPAMKRSYSGPAGGKGAVYEWDGNMQVGKGRIEIKESRAPSKIVLALDMIKPMEGHNTVGFTLVPHGGSTDVTWAMDGRTHYVAKVMSVFFSMDHMIGREFETGLANLKSLAEKQAATAKPAVAPAG